MLPLLLLLLAASPAAAADPASPWIAGEGVSVKRPGNKIVAWALPDAQKRFGRAGLEAIVAAADRDLKSLGVSTRFVVYTGKNLSRETADALGKLVIVGSKEAALPLAAANGLLSKDDADWLERTWAPDGTNPEKSDFNAGGKGRFTMIGTEACFGFAKEAGALTPAEAAALFAIHGVGHQAGIGMGGPHPAEQNFMDDGSRLLSMLNGKLYLSGGVGVQLAKRPAADLFKASAFETATAYEGHDGPKQKDKWLAAFAP